MQSLHRVINSPNRSLTAIFQLLTAIFNNQPSGIRPSKKGNKIGLNYISCLIGKVKLMGLIFPGEFI